MAFFSCLPPIPAVNRWGKLAGPVAWWLGASSFYSVMPQVLLLAREQMGGAEEADPINAATVGLGEPETEAHVRLVRQTRWKKALRWLLDNLTKLHLSICCCIMQPGITFMGKALFDARLREASSVLPYLSRATSPAERTFIRLADRMRAQASEYWCCITGDSGEWTDTALHLTATCCLMYHWGVVHAKHFGV